MSLHPYSMQMSLHVLEHLGLNLYSNIPAVLSEAVANAWDADAEIVRITFDDEAGKVVINDDGVGMNRDEVNNRFLTVGYRRRKKQPGKTAKGRSPMGRKGIGKLSLFSIANSIEVHTLKNGEKSAFLMKTSEIRNAIEKADGKYHPAPLSEHVVTHSNGTVINLSDLRKKKTQTTVDALRRRLARRFTIIGAQHNFQVFLNEVEITPADRDYYSNVQYLWTYGDQSEVLSHCPGVGKHEDRTEFASGEKIHVNGWLGTVTEVRHLKCDSGEDLNRVAIYIRGKMAQGDILDELGERGVYASYLIGELWVEGFDEYDGSGTEEDDDAATSSRQSLNQDDPRYAELLSLLKGELKNIGNKWTGYRIDDGARQAVAIPAVATWIAGLKGETKKRAKQWVGKINSLRTNSLEDKKNLIKHSILAFEFYRCNENLDKLESLDGDDIGPMLEVFEDLDNLELNLYGQIVKTRLEIISALRIKVDDNKKEKVIQEYIFDHLWLLDPSWERVEGSELMEARVDKLFEEINAKLTEEERAGRVDIQYRQSAGAHIVVELKRPGRSVSVYDLSKQIHKYKTGMRKLLDAQNRHGEPVYFICLLGKNPTESNETGGKTVVEDTLQPLGARVLLYDELLSNAEDQYRDYIKTSGTVGKLGEIIAEIDDFLFAPDDDD